MTLVPSNQSGGFRNIASDIFATSDAVFAHQNTKMPIKSSLHMELAKWLVR